jgi:hypothetical protein
MPTISKRIQLPILALWLAGAFVGFKWLSDYQYTPGAAAAVVSAWPAGSTIPRPTDRCLLLMFAHPQCACTDASVEELARIMAQTGGKLSAIVMFVRPNGFSEGWEKTELWTAAARIPGVNAMTDVGGVEARRFDARTSGQTFLYSPDGRLLFHGGITDGRGHEGDNTGADAVIDFVRGNPAPAAQTAVFGCELLDPVKDRVGGAAWTN